MALIRCPECLYEVSDQADKCPNCGFAIDKQKTAGESENKSTEERKSKNWGCLIFVLIIVGIPLLVWGSLTISDSIRMMKYEKEFKAECEEKGWDYNAIKNSSSKSKIDSSEEIESAAYVLSQEAVKSQLKAPSTAKFCKQSECTFVSTGTNKYMMTGWVDAENGFGAMLRADWAVVMELDGTKMKMISVAVG